MENIELNTESKIIKAAYDIFLLYGYHGTKLRQIASQAGVHTSVIHYYFRSKERLYETAVKVTLDMILITNSDFSTPAKSLEKPTWFLNTELYNNKDLFVNTLKHLYPDDWKIKLVDLKNKLAFQANSEPVW
jgi:AcrR family transcriptional regulator